MRKFLIIEKINIVDANAFSSAYTIGFPAMPAWLGFVHNLQRKLSLSYSNLKLSNVGIVCNDFEARLFKENKFSRNCVIEKRHPLIKDGKTDAFIEEPLCSLNVSLIIELANLQKYDEDDFIKSLSKLLKANIKIASGNIWSYKNINIKSIDEDNSDDIKKILTKLNSGFAIINKSSLLKEDMKLNNLTAFDSLVSFMEVKSKANIDENKNVQWTNNRKTKGWLVPIAVGYQGLSKLSIIHNQRDKDVKHRFAEAIVSLGEFIMPYRLTSIDEMLWHYEYIENKNLYLCK